MRQRDLCLDRWWKTVLALAVYAVAVFAVVYSIGLLINSQMRDSRARQCESLATQTGMDVRYIEVSRFNFDCYIRVGDTWVPRGQFRGEP